MMLVIDALKVFGWGVATGIISTLAFILLAFAWAASLSKGDK